MTDTVRKMKKQNLMKEKTRDLLRFGWISFSCMIFKIVHSP